MSLLLFYLSHFVCVDYTFEIVGFLNEILYSILSQVHKCDCMSQTSESPVTDQL